MAKTSPILSEVNGNTNSLFGEIQLPIAAYIERRDEAWMKDTTDIARKIFKKTASTHAAEAYAGLEAMNGGFLPVGENGAYPVSTIAEGDMKSFRNKSWKNSFSISAEMMDDKMDNILQGKPVQFMDSYYRTINNFLFGLLGAAIQNKAAMKFEGEAFDVTTADGVKLFASNHKGKTNQGNAFSDAFSASALGKIATAMQNFEDELGNVLTMQPDTLIIPNDEDIKAEVFGVLGAYHDPTTAAGNKFNYHFGNWNVIVSPYLNKYVTNHETSGLPYILFDSKYNESYFGAIFQMRKELTVRSVIDEDTDANVWKGSARFTGGFVDWRPFAIGGVSFGSAA